MTSANDFTHLFGVPDLDLASLAERTPSVRLGEGRPDAYAPQASDEMTASARPHALGSFLGTALLIALSQQGLLMQNRAQQRIVDLDVPIIADEA